MQKSRAAIHKKHLASACAVHRYPVTLRSFKMFMKPGPTQKEKQLVTNGMYRLASLASRYVPGTPMLASYACTVTSCVLHVLLQLRHTTSNEP